MRGGVQRRQKHIHRLCIKSQHLPGKQQQRPRDNSIHTEGQRQMFKTLFFVNTTRGSTALFTSLSLPPFQPPSYLASSSPHASSLSHSLTILFFCHAFLFISIITITSSFPSSPFGLAFYCIISTYSKSPFLSKFILPSLFPPSSLAAALPISRTPFRCPTFLHPFHFHVLYHMSYLGFFSSRLLSLVLFKFNYLPFLGLLSSQIYPSFSSFLFVLSFSCLPVELLPYFYYCFSLSHLVSLSSLSSYFLL